MRSPPPTTEQILTAFHTGQLDRLDGQFVPCDHFSLWFSMPFVAIAYIIPFIGVVGVVLALFDGSEQSQTYIRNFLNSDLPTQLLGLFLLSLAIGIASWQFFSYWPALQLDARGLRESLRERRTGEKRYGLMLMADWFALRCFSIGYHDPFIVPRDRIRAFHLYSEYSATSHQPHQYIVMTADDADGEQHNYRLPDASLDVPAWKLHRLLTDWLDLDNS